jgi:hypothetical protein
MKLYTAPCDAVASDGAFEVETTADVRHQIRYPLRAPVSFTWFSREGETREAKGNSRNIGEGGAYVLTRNCPPVGAQIILVFRFPYQTECGLSHRLEMSGQVVRAEFLPSGKGMWGFAVASTWTMLQETEDSNQGSRDTA